MRRRSDRICIALLVSVFAFCPYICSVPARAGEQLNGVTEANADEVIARFLTPDPSGRAIRPKALSVAIGSNGSLTYAKAFGEARAGALATPETIYKIGSISKKFTAAAILKLIELKARIPGSDQALTLDRPVSSILHDARAWDDPERSPMTLRTLLTMTSGLPNFTRRPPSETDPWRAVAAPKLRTALAELKRVGPQDSFEYTNTGYFLLAEIIKSVGARDSGESYAEILRRLVLSSVPLNATGAASDPDIQARLARPHYNRRPAFIQPDWLQGSGDLASNALDLFKWNSALMKVLRTNTASIGEMFSDAARVDAWTYYGMGWFINHKNERDTYFHSGSVPGYTSFNLIVRTANDDWHSVSLLTNSDGVEGLDDLADQLAEISINQLHANSHGEITQP